MFDADPTTEFDHFLAAKLGMTVERMRREISSDEYVDWTVYYARQAQRLELDRLRAGG
jgi:hypothetical protein